MSNETAREKVISELYNLYTVNGFITENEALDCFAVHKIPLSEIDSISEHLLGLGVLIQIGDDEGEDEEFLDHSKLDYNEIFKEVLEINPGLKMLIDYVRSITPPQNREWQKLIPQIQSGNKYAQNRLIEMYLRTVIKQALYHSKRYNLPLEDTIQDGVIGIMLAIQKFDSSSHETFYSYASLWIGQSISRLRWVPTNPMYFPVQVKETLFQIQEHINAHICEKCYANDTMTCSTLCAEIGGKYEITINEAVDHILHLKQCCSLDEAEDSENEIFSDYGFQNEEIFDKWDLSDSYNRAIQKMEQLNENERLVLTLRFGLVDGNEHTLEEMGGELNVTRERIRQIETKALRKLRKMLGIKEPDNG